MVEYVWGWARPSGLIFQPPNEKNLNGLFKELIEETNNEELPNSAYSYFLKAAAHQFFWDAINGLASS